MYLYRIYYKPLGENCLRVRQFRTISEAWEFSRSLEKQSVAHISSKRMSIHASDEAYNKWTPYNFTYAATHIYSLMDAGVLIELDD